MRKLFFVSLCVFFYNVFVAQNAKIIEGACLDDSPVQLFLKYIDADSSGVYFLKKQKEKPYSVYIEKYDAVTLQRVYKCIVPTIFEDNDIGKSDDVTYKRHFAILKNGCVYLMVSKIEGSGVDIYAVKVDKNGKPGGSFEKIHTQPYMSKIKRDDVYFAMSPNKNYLCIYNKGEIKNTTVISNLKINYGDNISLKQVFEYNLEYSKSEDENSLQKVYNSGCVGAFYNYNSEGKPRFATVGRTGKLYSKNVADLFHGEVEMSPFFLWAIHEDGGEIPVAVFNTKTKRYGFANLKFDTLKNELVNNGISYVTDGIATRLGKMKNFEFYGSAQYLEAITTLNYTYKIISNTENRAGPKFSYDIQRYLNVLIYDKQNKLVDQKLVPYKLDYVELYQMMIPFGDFFGKSENKNYSTIVRKDTLYILTNESTANRHLDPETASLNDFEVCKDIKSCYYTGYKIIPGGKTERFVAKINNPNDYAFTIPNNKSVPGNYQYVYLKVKDKKTLGKIVLE